VDRFATSRYVTVQACPWPPVAGATLWITAVQRLIAYWTRLVHLRGKGYILVSDRVDSNIPRDCMSQEDRATTVGRALSRWLPQPDLLFAVTSQPGAAGTEQSEHGLATRRLDATLPTAVLADEVQRVTRAWMLDRSLALLIHAAPAAATAARVPAQVVDRR
jgi:hypothetical protein